MKFRTPAERLILRVAQEEIDTLDAGYSWQERVACITRAANRLGISNGRVAQVYDRWRNE